MMDVQVTYRGVRLEVEGDYCPEQSGCRSGSPDYWTPDWPGEFEIAEVFVIDDRGGYAGDIFPMLSGESLREIESLAYDAARQKVAESITEYKISAMEDF